MANEASVTRTYRTAIRCGEDFITIEESISLPIGASDEEIAQAVETGLRIYRAQQTAVEQQAAAIREQSSSATPRILDPDSPASDKQRSYLDHLAQLLEWPADRLPEYLREHGASYDTLTKGQASLIIDELKSQVDGRRELAAGAAPQAERSGEPVSEKQLKALEKLAHDQRLDLPGEVRSRFGLESVTELSVAQAAQLLKELQPVQRRARQEAPVMQERRR